MAGISAEIFCDEGSRFAVVLDDEDIGRSWVIPTLLSVIRGKRLRNFVSVYV